MGENAVIFGGMDFGDVTWVRGFQYTKVSVGENAVIFGGMDFGDVTWVRGFQYTKGQCG